MGVPISSNGLLAFFGELAGAQPLSIVGRLSQRGAMFAAFFLFFFRRYHRFEDNPLAGLHAGFFWGPDCPYLGVERG